MSLLFRAGRPDDVPVVARLAAHSFPAAMGSLAEREEALLDSPHGGLDTLWVGEEGGVVIAACRLYTFEQWIGGQALPIMGLGMVAISPTARRRGIAGRLTRSALEQARTRGALASALYPFRTAFYRKLGYGVAGEAHQFRVPLAAIPDHPDRQRVTLAETPDDRAAMAAVYDRWAPGQTGQLTRRPRSWDAVWQRDTRHGALYRDEGGLPVGYVIFRYPLVPGSASRMIEVEEIAWLDRSARSALYAWIASLSDQWDHLLYRAHPEEAFPEHLKEIRFPTSDADPWHYWFPAATILHGPMFRLLDVERAWSRRSIAPGPAITLALEVHDEQIAANAGGWTLRLGDGSVHPSRGLAEAPDVRLQMGIECLSRVFIGSLTLTAAVMAGVATADRPDRLPDLDRMLRLPIPWMFDRF